MPGEFSLIDAFVSVFGPPPPPRGPGDDCAVVPPERRQVCIKTDAVVEGVHFTLPRFSLADVGHKALAVNLSDLAAMGAAPSWFVCALAMPHGATRGQVRALARGMAALARKSGAVLVGGNFTASPVLSVTLTVAGTLSGAPLLRSGAREGDVLYASGTLGDARAGLSSRRPELVRRQKRPQPRLALGLLAARFAHAAIDLSDGLAQDLSHVCRASGVGATVELARLPLSRSLLTYAGARAAAERVAAAGGEDYELVLAVPPSQAAAFERACALGGHRVTAIGRFAGRGPPRFVDAAGRTVRVGPGFDHFL